MFALDPVGAVWTVPVPAPGSAPAEEMPQWQASGQGIKLLLNIHGSYIYAVDESGQYVRANTQSSQGFLPIEHRSGWV